MALKIVNQTLLWLRRNWNRNDEVPLYPAPQRANPGRAPDSYTAPDLDHLRHRFPDLPMVHLCPGQQHYRQLLPGQARHTAAHPV